MATKHSVKVLIHVISEPDERKPKDCEIGEDAYASDIIKDFGEDIGEPLCVCAMVNGKWQSRMKQEMTLKMYVDALKLDFASLHLVILAKSLHEEMTLDDSVSSDEEEKTPSQRLASFATTKKPKDDEVPALATTATGGYGGRKKMQDMKELHFQMKNTPTLKPSEEVIALISNKSNEEKIKMRDALRLEIEDKLVVIYYLNDHIVEDKKKKDDDEDDYTITVSFGEKTKEIEVKGSQTVASLRDDCGSKFGIKPQKEHSKVKLFKGAIEITQKPNTAIGKGKGLEKALNVFIVPKDNITMTYTK